MRTDGKPLATAIISPLHKIQNECLRRVTGAYKRTPRAALKRETGIPPIDLYMEVNRYRRADNITEHEVEKQIAQTADIVWRRMRGAREAYIRPPTGREIVAIQAAERAQEIKEWIEETRTRRTRRTSARGPHASRRRNTRERNTRPIRSPGRASLIEKWGELA